jgi:hypothetical protein
MNTSELAEHLRTMYRGAPKGDAVAMIHLFGIKYAAQIKEAGVSARDIVLAAGINESYAVEVNKGINLDRYVEPRPQYR